jgi:hypothetical protein
MQWYIDTYIDISMTQGFVLCEGQNVAGSHSETLLSRANRRSCTAGFV